MFLKKLRSRNKSSDEADGILERIRQERCHSPAPRTISALADARDSHHSQKELTRDRFIDELNGILGSVNCLESMAEENATPKMKMLAVTRYLALFHRDFARCLATIRQYEADLASLCASQSADLSDRDPVPLEELVRRAYMLSSEADRWLRRDFTRISGLEESVRKRTKEVRALRRKVNELENELVEARIRFLKEKCYGEVSGQIQKEGAIDALITALKESESKRRLFAQELLRLKAINESRNAPDSEFSSNLFTEIIELREIVKELSTRGSPLIGSWNNSQSFPRPVPIPESEPSVRYSSTDLTARENEDIFASLSNSFSAELQRDAVSPRDE